MSFRESKYNESMTDRAVYEDDRLKSELFYVLGKGFIWLFLGTERLIQRFKKCQNILGSNRLYSTLIWTILIQFGSLVVEFVPFFQAVNQYNDGFVRNNDQTEVILSQAHGNIFSVLYITLVWYFCYRMR